MSVHSVRAASAVLGHVEAYLPPDRGRVVLHWFTGSPAEARRGAALGCYFSVNAEMLRTDRHRALLAQIPRDRLLTETDGHTGRDLRELANPSPTREVLSHAAGTPSRIAARPHLRPSVGPPIRRSPCCPVRGITGPGIPVDA
jgi:TatD DNase family protein